MMVNLMRSNQRWLMIIISVLVIISLFWFYANRAQTDRVGSDRAGKIYDRTVTISEYQRIARRLQVSRSLGTYNLSRAVSDSPYDQYGSPINYLVLEHQADQLGIQPSEDEIRAAGEALPVFKGANGEYDPARKNEFVSNVLFPYGMGENQIDELVRMNLIAGKLREIVLSPVFASPDEVRTTYDEGYAKTDASVIRLKLADVAPSGEPTEDEIKKYFADQKDQFKQPERRKVQYVKFSLDDAQKTLQGRPRMEALKPLADDAAQFLEKLLDQKGKEDFAACAASDKLTVKETPEFAQDQGSGFEEASIPQFAEAAFKLSKASPDSDVPLETPDAFYDLHLVGVTPERPLTLEEARPKIVSAIKVDRAHTALTAKAEEIRTKIAGAIKAGHSFADAAKDAGQTVANVPPFSLAEPDRKLPDAGEISSIAEGLANGELSKFTPTADGGLLVYVQTRTGIDPAKYESAKQSFTAQVQSQKSQLYFFEWLRASRDAANPQFNLRNEG